MQTEDQEQFVERLVTHTLEIEGELCVIQNVPARISLRTGERDLAAETMRRLIGIHNAVPKTTESAKVYDFDELISNWRKDKRFNDKCDVLREYDLTDRLASLSRLVILAHTAKDEPALGEAMYLLEDSVNLFLGWHLRKHDVEWRESHWFDGWGDPFTFEASTNELRIQTRQSWVIDLKFWLYDPLEFEIQLDPTTRRFQSYHMKFGDDTQIEAKQDNKREMAFPPSGGWKYVFEHVRDQADGSKS